MEYAAGLKADNLNCCALKYYRARRSERQVSMICKNHNRKEATGWLSISKAKELNLGLLKIKSSKVGGST